MAQINKSITVGAIHESPAKRRVKPMKKTLSLILSLLMIITTISALPFSASAEPTESSYTVTFTPNENYNWENVYFYCNSGDYAWPGVKMTQSGSNYTVAINTTSVPALFILNNGSGMQTYDIEFKSDGSKIDVTTIGTCTITEAITYYDGELGAIYSPESTTFRYWAPDATSVNLGIVGNVDQPMQKLMDGTQWTGVWTITLAGNYLNYRYYFVVDGVNKSDPYGKESNGYFGTMVTTSEATNPYGWNSDNHYFFDNNESSGVMSFVDVGSFLSDATAGVRMDRYGKYLAVLDDRSSVNNAGNVATGNYFLHYYSDIDSVCIDIASSSNLMLPKLEYASYMYTDEGVMVNEVKQMIQALHNIGLAVILNLDFTSAPFTGDMLTKYIVDTCTYWANEYHIDGFVLKEMISPEAETALKSALDEIDTRFFLAGTSTYRLRNENYLSGIATMPQMGSPIPNQIRSLMTDQTSLYTHEAGNMDDLMLTIAAMSRGRMTLNFGQEFGGYGNPVDWSKLGNSYNYETEEAVFEHTYSYFRQLMEIRKNFAPLYSVKGTQQASTSGNTIVCNYTNDAQCTDEWQKLKVLINLNTNERSFNNNDNWVVIAKSGTTDGTVDYKNGLEVINGTNVSVAAKSAVIMVDKASFDEMNAVRYNLWVGGTQVTSANASDVFGDGTVKYNDETKTLTLNNYTFEGAGYDYQGNDSYRAGIYCENAGSELNLELIGTNTVKETYGSSSTALLFTGSLKITGSGTLNAISCDTNGYSLGIDVHENLTISQDFTGVINATSGDGGGSAFMHGIFCWRDAVISGGTINATSGTGQYTYGFQSDNLTVNGGTINATGGDTTDRSMAGTYGIETGTFIINGGAVTAKSGKTANKNYCWSCGLRARDVCINGGVIISSSDFATSGSLAVRFENDITIANDIKATASVNNDGSNAVAYNKNNNDNYKWFKSEPAPPPIYYNVTVCGTQVTSANASDVLGDGTVSYNPETKTLTLNNANITGTNSAIYSIHSDLNVELIGNNTLTVTGYSEGISFNKGSEESANLTFTGSGTLNLNTESGKGINVRGTMTVDGPNINIHSTGTAIAATENSDIIVKSGSLNIKSDEEYGIFNYIFGDNKGSIQVSGGTLTVDSALGGTNITDITFNGVEYTEGTDLSHSGKVCVGAHIHSLSKVSATAATIGSAGNKEYYTCTCGKWFEDAEGTVEITDTSSVVIPALPEPTPESQPEPSPVLTPEEAAMPTETATAKLINKTNTDKYDVVGSEYKRLQPRATAKKQSITLKWKKVGGANGYIIYGALCGQPMKPIKTITNPNTVKTTFSSLKKGKYYKYIVSAYKDTADGKRIISKSKSVHCCTDGGKKGNPTKLTLKKSKLTVKKGKSVKISGKVSGKKKVSVHIAKARFESSNTSIATVDKNGKVKGKKKGTATIYVYAQDGLCKTVKVKVK